MALSNSIFTDAAVAADTVTVTSFEVAVASATVAASMILNLAVPTAIAVTGQLCLELTVSYAAHATGVTEPATRASAAEEATIYAAPVQVVPLASTATMNAVGRSRRF